MSAASNPPNLSFRRALPEDLDAVLALWTQASAFLRLQGVNQWQKGYPGPQQAQEDCALGRLWLALTPDGQPAAVFVFDTTPEPSYAHLTEGAWQHPGPYGVLHRVAVSPAVRGQGVGGAVAAFGRQRCAALGLPALRIDTHPENRPMRRMLEKAGFTAVGMLRLLGGVDDGAPRVAYELLL